MQKNLFLKYYSICLSIILLGITILGSILMLFAAQYFTQEKQQLLSENVQSAVEITKGNVKNNQGNYASYAVLSTGYKILGNAIGANVFFVDTSGKCQVCTEEQPCIHTTYILPEEILDQVFGKGSYKELGDMEGLYKTKFYSVGAPVVLEDGTTVGAVFASMSADTMVTFLKELLRMFLLASLAVIILSLIVIYVAIRVMVKPLRDMAKAANRFAKGDFSQKVQVTSEDEMGQLARAFNDMAASLAQLEQVRRSFIANVSHELRTPMTTISGFIDGILDGTIPDSQRDHYLQIASEEVKRLSRLVRSMLNISRLEAGEMDLSLEVFDACEVIRQTVFSFEKVLTDKNIEVRGLDADRVMVSADRDLIHQVVYNLVDNAVKFTPQDGYLEFNFYSDNHTTFVGIKNSGDGIAKEEMPKVFERFYKTDKSRGLNKNGVGLGLYIVRSIINLHGGNVIVRSKQGEYCEFVFSLSTAKPTKTSGKAGKNAQN